MTQTNTPSFDGTITVKDIQRQATLELEFMETALRIKDYDAMEYYKHLADTYHSITNIMMENALLPISDILQLPVIRIRAISLTTSVIREHIGEATAFVELETGSSQHKERVQCKIQGPEERTRVQKFKDDMSDIVKQSQLQDVDLFALTKKKEKTIKAKVLTNKELTPEEERLLFAKDIKDTIIEMIRNGGRIEAVNLVQNYIFKYQNFSNAEANMLVEAVKTHYKVDEPRDKPTIEFTSVENLPENTWLKLQYLIKEKTKEKKEKIGGAYGMLSSEKPGVIMDQYGKFVCDAKKTLYYRPTFKYEEQRIIDVVNNL